MPSKPAPPKPKSLLKAAVEHTSTDNVNDIPSETVKLADRAADFVAKWYGSWVAFWISMIVIGCWTAFNSYQLSVLRVQIPHFDPYPYIFLNFVLAIISSMAQIFILMSQNRSGQRDSAILEEITLTTMRAEAVLLEIENGFGILSVNQHDLLVLQSAIVDALQQLNTSITAGAINTRANTSLLNTISDSQIQTDRDLKDKH